MIVYCSAKESEHMQQKEIDGNRDNRKDQEDYGWFAGQAVLPGSGGNRRLCSEFGFSHILWGDKRHIQM